MFCRYAYVRKQQLTQPWTVLAAVDLNTHLLLVRRMSILHIVGFDFTIFELYALRNLLQVVSSYILIKVYMIDLLLQILRMGELRSQITIVGKKQYTCRVTV